MVVLSLFEGMDSVTTESVLLPNNYFFKKWRPLGCYAVWLVRTVVSEELSASVIRDTGISELGTTSVRRLLVTADVVPSASILVTLMI
jgi:hypothetical protein